jgi:hypothetical protein
MAIYDYNPPYVLIFYENEWEDYGTFGIGNEDGHPFRTGTYLAFDENGEEALANSLQRALSETVPDEEQRRAAVKVFLAWLQQHSNDIQDFESARELIGFTEREMQAALSLQGKEEQKQ